MKTKEIGKPQTKEKVIDLLNANGIPHLVTKCRGCDRIFISLTDDGCDCQSCAITVQTCSKDVCRVYPNEILYIAIEDRKSVLYLKDRKIETHYPMEHWKNMLDKKFFAQPHYSYIVNLHYVTDVTKNFVILRCGEGEYKVYTSSRKVGAFKKAVLEFDE